MVVTSNNITVTCILESCVSGCPEIVLEHGSCLGDWDKMVMDMRLELLCFILETLWFMDVSHGSVGNYYIFYSKIWLHICWETNVLDCLYFIICGELYGCKTYHPFVS